MPPKPPARSVVREQMRSEIKTADFKLREYRKSLGDPVFGDLKGKLERLIARTLHTRNERMTELESLRPRRK